MCYRTGKYTVWRQVRASFSPEILHAGAVKGLNIPYVKILTDLATVAGEATLRLSVSNSTMMLSDRNSLSPFSWCRVCNQTQNHISNTSNSTNPCLHFPCNLPNVILVDTKTQKGTTTKRRRRKKQIHFTFYSNWITSSSFYHMLLHDPPIFQLYTASHSLCSVSYTLSLQIPCTRLSAVGSCAVSVCGPFTWNDLPLPLQENPSLDSFNSNLTSTLTSRHFFFQNNRPAMFFTPLLCV